MAVLKFLIIFWPFFLHGQHRCKRGKHSKLRLTTAVCGCVFKTFLSVLKFYLSNKTAKQRMDCLRMPIIADYDCMQKNQIITEKN